MQRRNAGPVTKAFSVTDLLMPAMPRKNTGVRKALKRSQGQLMRRFGSGGKQNVWPPKWEPWDGANPLANEDKVTRVEPTMPRKIEMLETYFRTRHDMNAERIAVIRSAMSANPNWVLSTDITGRANNMGPLPERLKKAYQEERAKYDGAPEGYGRQVVRRQWEKEARLREAENVAIERIIAQMSLVRADQEVAASYIHRFQQFLRGKPCPEDAAKMKKLGFDGKDWFPSAGDDVIAYLRAFSAVRAEYYWALWLLLEAGPGTNLRQMELYFKYLIDGDDLEKVTTHGIWHYLEFGRSEMPEEIARALNMRYQFFDGFDDKGEPVMAETALPPGLGMAVDHKPTQQERQRGFRRGGPPANVAIDIRGNKSKAARPQQREQLTLGGNNNKDKRTHRRSPSDQQAIDLNVKLNDRDTAAGTKNFLNHYRKLNERYALAGQTEAGRAQTQEAIAEYVGKLAEKKGITESQAYSEVRAQMAKHYPHLEDNLGPELLARMDDTFQAEEAAPTNDLTHGRIGKKKEEGEVAKEKKEEKEEAPAKEEKEEKKKEEKKEERKEEPEKKAEEEKKKEEKKEEKKEPERKEEGKKEKEKDGKEAARKAIARSARTLAEEGPAEKKSVIFASSWVKHVGTWSEERVRETIGEYTKLLERIHSEETGPDPQLARRLPNAIAYLQFRLRQIEAGDDQGPAMNKAGVKPPTAEEEARTDAAYEGLSEKEREELYRSARQKVLKHTRKDPQNLTEMEYEAIRRRRGDAFTRLSSSFSKRNGGGLLSDMVSKASTSSSSSVPATEAEAPEPSGDIKTWSDESVNAELKRVQEGIKRTRDEGKEPSRLEVDFYQRLWHEDLRRANPRSPAAEVEPAPLELGEAIAALPDVPEENDETLAKAAEEARKKREEEDSRKKKKVPDDSRALVRREDSKAKKQREKEEDKALYDGLKRALPRRPEGVPTGGELAQGYMQRVLGGGVIASVLKKIGVSGLDQLPSNPPSKEPSPAASPSPSPQPMDVSDPVEEKVAMAIHRRGFNPELTKEEYERLMSPENAEMRARLTRMYRERRPGDSVLPKFFFQNLKPRPALRTTSRSPKASMISNLGNFMPKNATQTAASIVGNGALRTAQTVVGAGNLLAAGGRGVVEQARIARDSAAMLVRSMPSVPSLQSIGNAFRSFMTSSGVPQEEQKRIEATLAKEEDEESPYTGEPGERPRFTEEEKQNLRLLRRALASGVVRSYEEANREAAIGGTPIATPSFMKPKPRDRERGRELIKAFTATRRGIRAPVEVETKARPPPRSTTRRPLLLPPIAAATPRAAPPSPPRGLPPAPSAAVQALSYRPSPPARIPAPPVAAPVAPAVAPPVVPPAAVIPPEPAPIELPPPAVEINPPQAPADAPVVAPPPAVQMAPPAVALPQPVAAQPTGVEPMAPSPVVSGESTPVSGPATPVSGLSTPQPTVPMTPIATEPPVITDFLEHDPLLDEYPAPAEFSPTPEDPDWITRPASEIVLSVEEANALRDLITGAFPPPEQQPQEEPERPPRGSTAKKTKVAASPRGRKTKKPSAATKGLRPERKEEKASKKKRHADE
jgi:hypothetical protein